MRIPAIDCLRLTTVTLFLLSSTASCIAHPSSNNSFTIASTNLRDFPTASGMSIANISLWNRYTCVCVLDEKRCYSRFLFCINCLPATRSISNITASSHLYVSATPPTHAFKATLKPTTVSWIDGSVILISSSQHFAMMLLYVFFSTMNFSTCSSCRCCGLSTTCACSLARWAKLIDNLVNKCNTSCSSTQGYALGQS